MSRSSSETLLRRALAANAGFSLLTGSVCWLAAEQVASFVGIPILEAKALGLNLEVFAVGIFFLLTRDLSKTWARNVVGGIIALDVLWVVGSAALLMSAAPLTVAGKWTVGIIAMVVADFAFFQWRGWRGMSKSRAAVAPVAEAA